MYKNQQIQKQAQIQIQTLGTQKSQPLTIHTPIQPKQRFGHKPTIMHRPQIDGLRCLAIMPVIFFHYEMFNTFTSGGFAGVDVFFVISGFLVNSIIISELLKEKFSILTFYERRVRRLFPAIFTTLGICLLIGYIIYFEKYRFQELVFEQTVALGSVTNIYFYMNRHKMGTDYFNYNVQKFPLLHFWSLAVEEQFYLITPLALMLLMKLSSQRKFLKCMFFYSILTILVSLLLSVIITPQNQMFAFYLLPCRAWELGLGGLVAILLHQKMLQKIKQRISQYRVFRNEKMVTILLQVSSWSGLVMILMSYAMYNKIDDNFPGYKALLPCFGVAIYIASNFIRYQQVQVQERLEISQDSQIQVKNILPSSSIKRKMLTSAKFLSLRPIVWVGQISYSLYLWHWPIWILYNHYLEKTVSLYIKVYCLLVTFVLAYLSTKQIENPIRNKRKVSTKRLWIGFVVIWGLFMGILIYCRVADVGGFSMQDYIIPSNGTNITIYQQYDFQGTSLKNPNRQLEPSQIHIQKLKRPMFTPGIYRIQFNQTFRTSADLQPIYFNYPNKDKPICLSLLGSSHTQQHINTLRILANEYNVSMAVLAGSNTSLQFNVANKKQWDQWRLKQLKQLKPKMIFASHYWYFMKDGDLQQKLKNLINPLLELPTPPKYIGLFGDNSLTGFGSNKLRKKIGQFLIEKSVENDGWQYLNQLHEPTLPALIRLQQKMGQYLSKNYDNKIVNFYPHLYQFLQDYKTKSVQLLASQADGQLLYKDHNHLTIFGSMRYKRYFQEKIFKRAKKLCK